jgi:hypothetical protein
MKQNIEKLLNNISLTQKESHDIMLKIMSGEFSDAQISGFLIALRAKVESSSEIAGFAQAMRDKMTKIESIDDAIDMCGTGGDASGTFNISTAASFVVAGAGVPVAKHGNRSMTSKSGSADVLTELGVDITLPPEKVSECIAEIGIGFMFAPSLHPAMKIPMSCRVTPAGLQSGPKMLKTVRVPNATLAPMAYFIAGCKDGANIKPIPISAIHSDTFSGGSVISTPNSVSTSAEPDFEVIERFPCFATGTPAPATTKDAAVEILNVPLASPPVPHISIASSMDSILVILSRMA